MKKNAIVIVNEVVETAKDTAMNTVNTKDTAMNTVNTKDTAMNTVNTKDTAMKNAELVKTFITSANWNPIRDKLNELNSTEKTVATEMWWIRKCAITHFSKIKDYTTVDELKNGIMNAFADIVDELMPTIIENKVANDEAKIAKENAKKELAEKKNAEKKNAEKKNAKKKNAEKKNAKNESAPVPVEA